MYESGEEMRRNFRSEVDACESKILLTFAKHKASLTNSTFLTQRLLTIESVDAPSSWQCFWDEMIEEDRFDHLWLGKKTEAQIRVIQT